jgi:flagellin
MARINTNVPSLVARANLARAGEELETRLQRLSTGLRINRGADDPAGLITSERLRSDIQGVNQGIENADRASSVIATAEGALTEVNDLLNSIRSLIVESANTGASSPAERDANQLQIDSAIDSITRISNTASFGGLKLLNGSLDYVLSGVTTSAISKAQVFGANFISTSNLQVNVDVVASAQVGALYLRGDYTADPAWNGRLQSAMTFQIAGPQGVEVIQVPQSATLDSVIAAVNNLTSLTGVRAARINASDASSGMTFNSTTYGSDSFVSVRRLGGPDDPAADSFHTYKLANNAPVPGGSPFPWSSTSLTSGNRDDGKDVTALINGTLATGDGLNISVNTPSLSVSLLLNEQLATRPGQGSSFNITGGGALFQLGPQVTSQQQTNISIPSVAASDLGGVVHGSVVEYLSSLKSGQVNSIRSSVATGDFSVASDILSKAIDEVSILRGRLGAFERNVLQTNSRSLQAAVENLTASSSRIRDADFAAESSALTRAQVLSSAGTSVLSLANQQAQQVLQLLR